VNLAGMGQQARPAPCGRASHDRDSNLGHEPLHWNGWKRNPGARGQAAPAGGRCWVWRACCAHPHPAVPSGG